MKLIIGTKIKLIDGLILNGEPAKDGFIVCVKPLIASINGKVLQIKKNQISKVKDWGEKL